MTNIVTIEDVCDFLDSRKVRGFKKDNVMEVSLGGSRATGLVNENSDFDVRAVQLLSSRDLFGFDVLDMVKVIQGDSGVNYAGDLDVELYSSLSFLKGLAKGDLTAWEILFSTSDNRLGEEHAFMREVRANQHMFDSKSLLYTLIGSFKGCMHRLEIRDTKKVKSLTRVARVEKYGYDTKKADQALRLLRWMESYVTRGRFDLKESDELTEFSRGLREGSMTLSDFRAYAESEEIRIMKLVVESSMRKYCKLNDVSDFSVALHLKYANE